MSERNTTAAVFAGRRNGDKPASLVADMEGAGGKIIARAHDVRNEEEIVTFGAPTFFTGEDLYFCKDRLRDVEDALVAREK